MAGRRLGRGRPGGPADPPCDRWVDLHPVTFDADGNGIQAGPDGTTYDYPAGCLASGRIGDREGRCLGPARQLEAHAGYPPREVDRHDVAVLRGLVQG